MRRKMMINRVLRNSCISCMFENFKIFMLSESQSIDKQNSVQRPPNQHMPEQIRRLNIKLGIIRSNLTAGHFYGAMLVRAFEANIDNIANLVLFVKISNVINRPNVHVAAGTWSLYLLEILMTKLLQPRFNYVLLSLV